MPLPSDPGTSPATPPRSKNSDQISDQPLISPLPIATLAPDPKNPRRMSAAARAGLGVSMKTFGALDIVFNTRTGELVSGHQRVAELKAAGSTEVVMTSPDWGAIEHPATGDRFWVRFVDWDETKQRIGNLVSNSPELQGEFTPDAIDQLHAVQTAADAEALQLEALLDQLEKEFKAEPPQDGSTDQSGCLTDCWQIVVTCTSEAHQRDLLERFEKEGLKCRALI